MASALNGTDLANDVKAQIQTNGRSHEDLKLRVRTFRKVKFRFRLLFFAVFAAVCRICKSWSISILFLPPRIERLRPNCEVNN